MDLYARSYAVNTFGFDLLDQLSKTGGSGNVFFSPLSIFVCLNLALLGAKDKTEKNLFSGLRCEKSFKNVEEVQGYVKTLVSSYGKFDTNSSYMKLANRVLLSKEQDSVAETYKTKLVDIFKTTVEEVNFGGDRQEIVDNVNNWVKTKTNGMIEEILTPDAIDSLTKAILLNAIYFKGKWTHSFNSNATKLHKFYNNGKEDEAKDISMMHKSFKTIVQEFKFNGEEMIRAELPYDGNFNFNILLPKSRNGIQAFKGFQLSTLENIDKQFINVNLYLPKFKFETSYELTKELMSLGITEAFSANADFSGIRQGIFFSDVIHKAAIEVDEEGTKAAAVTGIIMNRFGPGIQHKEIELKVDHPFLFYISDESNGAISFIGKVLTI